MITVFNYIIEHWGEIICVIAMVCVVTVTLKEFFSLPKEEQINQIKGWLLAAVILAEKEYGGGTGRIKLSAVYNEFVDKFPWIARALTFSKFSEYVDDALVEMRKLLSDNNAVADYIASKDNEIIIVEEKEIKNEIEIDKEG